MDLPSSTCSSNCRSSRGRSAFALAFGDLAAAFSRRGAQKLLNVKAHTLPAHVSDRLRWGILWFAALARGFQLKRALFVFNDDRHVLTPMSAHGPKGPRNIASIFALGEDFDFSETHTTKHFFNFFDMPRSRRMTKVPNSGPRGITGVPRVNPKSEAAAIKVKTLVVRAGNNTPQVHISSFILQRSLSQQSRLGQGKVLPAKGLQEPRGITKRATPSSDEGPGSRR